MMDMKPPPDFRNQEGENCHVEKFCAALLLMLLLPACALAEVVISEIMTSNGTYENGHAYDWIELHNTGKSTVDISGWYLSDSKKNKMKFQFPQGTKLKADGYLTVFCTGNDEVNIGKGSEFYATFALSSSGEASIFRTRTAINCKS